MCTLTGALCSAGAAGYASICGVARLPAHCPLSRHRSCYTPVSNAHVGDAGVPGAGHAAFCGNSRRCLMHPFCAVIFALLIAHVQTSEDLLSGGADKRVRPPLSQKQEGHGRGLGRRSAGQRHTAKVSLKNDQAIRPQGSEGRLESPPWYSSGWQSPGEAGPPPLSCGSLLLFTYLAHKRQI